MATEEPEGRTAFGYNLRRIRRAKDLTQQELATKAGIHVNTVVRAEKGQDTRWSAVEKLAAALHVSPEEFSRPIPASDP